MNYADLFRMTLPETALEIAALVVLVVDLGFLRRATLRVRIFVASILGVFGCGAAIVAMTFQPPRVWAIRAAQICSWYREAMRLRRRPGSLS